MGKMTEIAVEQNTHMNVITTPVVSFGVSTALLVRESVE